jgi:hypothetical protein
VTYVTINAPNFAVSFRNWEKSKMIQHSGAVVAVGGRRIDPEPTLTPRFPFNQVDRVGMQIADQLSRSHAVVLISSAACGADLIALETAQRMGLRTRIILPFSAARFRETSVVDRPRPEFWGAMFDRVASVARAHATSSNSVSRKPTTSIQPQTPSLSTKPGSWRAARTMGDRAGRYHSSPSSYGKALHVELTMIRTNSLSSRGIPVFELNRF